LRTEIKPETKPGNEKPPNLHTETIAGTGTVGGVQPAAQVIAAAPEQILIIVLGILD